MDPALLVSVYDSRGETTDTVVLGTNGILHLYAGSTHQNQGEAPLIAKVHSGRQGIRLNSENGYALSRIPAHYRRGTVDKQAGQTDQKDQADQADQSDRIDQVDSRNSDAPSSAGSLAAGGVHSVELSASQSSIYKVTRTDKEQARQPQYTKDGRETVSGRPMYIYVRPSDQGFRSYRKLAVTSHRRILIGSGSSADIQYSHPLVSSESFTLQLQRNTFILHPLTGQDPVFINGMAVSPAMSYRLQLGDVVVVADLTLAIGNKFLSLNSPAGLEIKSSVSDLKPLFHKELVNSSPEVSSLSDSEKREESSDQDFFAPAPRLMQSVHQRSFKLESPPQKEAEKTSPAIMQLGPSFLMGVASVFMIVSTISRLQNGDGIMSVLPTIAMAAAMVAGMIIWPIISNFYDKHRRKRAEEKRVSRFTDYLNRVEVELRKESDKQAEILKHNRIEPHTIIDRALTRSPELMNRNASHSDFMELRLGVGNEELQANITYPENRFTLDNDLLFDRISLMKKNRPVISQVPVALDLYHNHVVGVIGERPLVWSALRGLMVQASGLYSYNDVKIILIANGQDSQEWDFARRLPHLFSDDRQLRFLACEPEDMIRVDHFLQKLYDERSGRQNRRSQADFGTFYLVFCTDRDLASRSPALSKWTHTAADMGVSVIFSASSLRSLPSECSTVVQITDPESDASQGKSSIFLKDDVDGTSRDFSCDIMLEPRICEDYARALSGIKLRRAGGKNAGFPQSLGYLDMCRVGNVGDLNVAERWRTHDASRTLATHIGLDAQGQPFVLDLHEDSHGPHGLIAGTTGSGKSELIITYILSMALDYAPDEVAFVLIDYKGGGLAGAFANGRHTLPHLAGTITNLDGSAINRSLAAIQSELEHRQRLFNKARDITGEPTMDIYKYLSYYRQGVVTDPMPHLFIVADEFAELKQQEPDFMDELISAARIGRSLGVHLILATQKPTGVVNDQIWSNSRFKISLKVADSADSKEMIRRPDAAELKNPGRFYLLVGYNDYFAQGQSAYTGVRYSPQSEYEEHHDTIVTLIGNTAEPLASLRPQKTHGASQQTELDAVLEQLGQTADDMKIHAHSLWLDPLPNQMSVEEFRRNYARLWGQSAGSPQSKATGLKTASGTITPGTATPGSCIATIGIIDDPKRQNQHLLQIDFPQIDNLIIYGQTSYGTESMVSTIVDSLVRDYRSDQINLYALDMGDGTLTAFNDAPQVGGTAVIDDKERVISLIHFISRTIAHRRRLLNSLGERYEDYIAEDRAGSADNLGSGTDPTAGITYETSPADSQREPLPRIVVALTNIAAFNEAYPQFSDMLTEMVHEGPRYGIHFVVTSTNFNQVNWRLRALFGLSLVTAFNNDDDYGGVLGSMAGTTPPRHYLRGLLLENNEKHEYQAADAGTGKQIRERCRQLSRNSSGTSAPEIPRLPGLVTPDLMVSAVQEERDIPLGYDKQEVYPLAVDGRKAPAFIITGNDAEALNSFARGLGGTLASAAGGRIHRGVLIVDSLRLMRDLPQDSENFHIATDISDIADRLEAVCSGTAQPAMVLFTDILLTLSQLPAQSRNRVTSYIENGTYKDTTNLVLIMERWRIENTYDAWLKAVRANPQGLWIGEGIKQESIFPNSNMPVEMNQAQAQTDGWVFYRGGRHSIRVIHWASDSEGGQQ